MVGWKAIISSMYMIKGCMVIAQTWAAESGAQITDGCVRVEVRMVLVVVVPETSYS